MKRFLNILFAIVAIVLLSPLMIAVSLVLMIQGGESPIFIDKGGEELEKVPYLQVQDYAQGGRQEAYRPPVYEFLYQGGRG